MRSLLAFLIQATFGICLVVLLALAVRSVCVGKQEQQLKWYELEEAEFQTVVKQLRTLRYLGNFNNKNGFISITFGRSPPTFVTINDGTYLFDAYRMIGPKDITHVLLNPAAGKPQIPPPPFQSPPSPIISNRELPDPANEQGDPSTVFPNAATARKGTAVYILEALGKVHLSITDVEKMMSHRL